MVVFTCSACGESLEKAHVEKHVLKCGSGQVLSCIDCSKDFCGDDYKNHSKCVSEDQKCGGKDVQVKENKGDVKQRQWIQRIQQAMERPDVEPNVKKILQRIQEAMERPDVEPNVKKILQKVSAHDNMPRKRATFKNWMRKYLKVYAPFFLEKVWEICSAAADSNGNQTKRQTASEKNENKTDEQKNKKHKRETSDENSEEQNGENTNDKQTRKKMKQEEKEQNEENADENSNKKQKKGKQEAIDESLSPEGEELENPESESNSTGKRDAPEDGLAVKKLCKKKDQQQLKV